MTAYLEKTKEALGQFNTTDITQVSKSENSNVDTLAQLATNLKDNLLKTVPVKVLETPSIGRSEMIAQVNAVNSWMDPLISYLCDKIILDDCD